LYRWARQTGLREPDAEDLVQEVFAILIRKLPEFHYRPGGSFRNWLRVVVVNKWRERQRRRSREIGGQVLEDHSTPDVATAFEENEYRRQLIERGLQLIEPEFSATAWAAFREHVVNDRGAAEVAAELGIRVGTVYAAKSRVLSRLRRELDGLIDCTLDPVPT
jgi:RNA polymerase sigma-70 factor (ECF subfamily)